MWVLKFGSSTALRFMDYQLVDQDNDQAHLARRVGETSNSERPSCRRGQVQRASFGTTASDGIMTTMDVAQ